jgi:hypothetical protein
MVAASRRRSTRTTPDSLWAVARPEAGIFRPDSRFRAGWRPVPQGRSESPQRTHNPGHWRSPTFAKDHAPLFNELLLEVSDNPLLGLYRSPDADKDGILPAG